MRLDSGKASSPRIALDQLLDGYVDTQALPPLTVTGLCLDSRKVASGDVYFALRGTQTHGIEFAEMAVSKGAVAILVDKDDAACAAVSQQISIPVVQVPQLAQAMGPLASRYFDHPSKKLSVCGVTGTDGKTSVCRFVADALQHLGHKVGYIGTIGWGLDGELAPNPLTTPDAITLQQMIGRLYKQGAEFIALEVSSHALVQGRVNGVRFDVAVLTNLGRDHLDYHGDIDAYKAAKSRLFDWAGMSAIVLNLDDEFGRELAQQHAGILPVSGFSVSGAASINSDQSVSAEEIQVNENGIAFTLNDGRNRYSIESTLLGQFNIENLMSCFAVLRAFGVAADTAAVALGQIASVPGRMERFGRINANVVVDFAHTPQALQAALQTLRSHCVGKLWVVFGCGGDRDPGKRAVMGEVAAREADILVVTDDNPRTEASADIIRGIVEGIPATAEHVVMAERDKAIEYAVQNAAASDWVLVAGKGHEDYQIVGTEYLPFSDREKVKNLVGPAGGQA